MTIPDRRLINLAGFLACAGMMAYALYEQFQNYLDPCPLCIFQRLAVIGIGILFLIATLHNPSGWGNRIYAALLALVSAGGIAVAGRHVWLQNNPPDELATCGPGLGYMLDNFPVGDALRMAFTGSGDCSEIHWQLLGLSMPAWVLISVATLGGVGIWNNLRKIEL